MGDFRCKVRYVAQGNNTEALVILIYVSFISREIVGIILTLATLNDVDIKTVDIQDSYLISPIIEKIWIILGPEFGNNTGKRVIVNRALCGLFETAFLNAYTSLDMNHSLYTRIYSTNPRLDLPMVTNITHAYCCI